MTGILSYFQGIFSEIDTYLRATNVKILIKVVSTSLNTWLFVLIYWAYVGLFLSIYKGSIIEDNRDKSATHKGVPKKFSLNGGQKSSDKKSTRIASLYLNIFTAERLTVG